MPTRRFNERMREADRLINEGRLDEARKILNQERFLLDAAWEAMPRNFVVGILLACLLLLLLTLFAN